MTESRPTKSELSSKPIIKVITMFKNTILILTLILSTSCGGDLGDDKYHISGVILDVGSCGGGEGFFSGNYECAVSVQTSSGVMYWDAYGQQIKGRTIYKECWIEEGSGYCFTTARNMYREMYKNTKQVE